MAETFEQLPAPVLAKLEEMAGRRAEIEGQLSEPSVLADHRAVRDLSIKKAALDAVVDRYLRLRSLAKEAGDLRAAIGSKEDADFAEMAREELPRVEGELERLSGSLLESLVTADDQSIGSVILEVRAGVGGDEAALWASEILDMYRKRAAKRGWSFEVLDISEFTRLFK